MFRIHNYSLGRDVISSLKKQMTNKKLFTNAPLAILNNFTGEGSHVKLMASVFQNMFPTINVTKVAFFVHKRWSVSIAIRLYDFFCAGQVIRN